MFIIFVVRLIKDFFDMEKITFRSRYGYEVFLKKISESRYELDGNFRILQMTKEADGNILAVDPEGGPMISVGDKIKDGKVISQIISEDDRIILVVKLHSCLTCTRFTNYRSDILCGDINTRIPNVDIRKGCDKWEEKGDTNWYMIFDGCKHIKHELTREEEDSILGEYFQNVHPGEHMSEERYDLAQHIKWRRVLEL